ncbi:hypothetical protein AB0L57_02285 [Nocardia sp. NPDC052254]
MTTMTTRGADTADLRFACLDLDSEGRPRRPLTGPADRVEPTGGPA